MMATMGGSAVEAQGAVGVVEGCVELRRPMAPAAIDDPDHLLTGWAEDCATGRSARRAGGSRDRRDG
jgi:hypothetical protein